MNLIKLCITLQIAIIRVFRQVTQVELQIQCTIPIWVMDLLLGRVNLSELERLDKPCATVGANLRPSHHCLVFEVHGLHPATMM